MGTKERVEAVVRRLFGLTPPPVAANPGLAEAERMAREQDEIFARLERLGYLVDVRARRTGDTEQDNAN